MEATIHRTGKKAVKILGAACLATSVAVLSAAAARGGLRSLPWPRAKNR